MAFAEKRAWIMLVVSTVVYVAYVVIILGRASGVPLAGVSYASTLLGAVVTSIVATIVANIAVGIATPKDEQKPDQRDREIHRSSEYVGQSFVVIGSLSALLLALAQAPYFWIANAVYACFVLSALLSSIVKIFGYRKGFGSW
jgi:cell division protein FtsW (lipid II flippase)